MSAQGKSNNAAGRGRPRSKQPGRPPASGSPGVHERPGGKMPYEKPMIVFEQRLEAMAAVCDAIGIGKAPGTCTFAFS